MKHEKLYVLANHQSAHFWPLPRKDECNATRYDAKMKYTYRKKYKHQYWNHQTYVRQTDQQN
eukprot:3791974-Karenia_brevis.AAC.1